jgi:hypothetical protein
MRYRALALASVRARAGSGAVAIMTPQLPSELSVTGVVYDVQTGRAEVIERNSPLRQAGRTSVPPERRPSGSGAGRR